MLEDVLSERIEVDLLEGILEKLLVFRDSFKLLY